MEQKTIWLDVFTLSTYNKDTNEICCPNCGSWTNFDDIIQNDDDFIGTCPLCRLEINE